MSTLGAIKAELAGLFTLPITDFTINGVDLLTVSINNAVRKAQLNHDFHRTKVLCDLVVSGVTGGPLSAMKLHGTATVVDLSKIIAIGPYTENGVALIPKTWMLYDEFIVHQQSKQGDEYDPDIRYPGSTKPSDTTVSYVIAGETVYPVPAGAAGSTVTIGLYGCKLFEPYPTGTGGDTTEDIFLKFGHDYVLWEAALELNHMKKEWVPRTEGNLPPPTTMRNEAWDAFVLWDSYQYNKFPEGTL